MYDSVWFSCNSLLISTQILVPASYKASLVQHIKDRMIQHSFITVQSILQVFEDLTWIKQLRCSGIFVLLYDIPGWVRKHFKGHFKETKMYSFEIMLYRKDAEDMAILATVNMKLKWNLIEHGVMWPRTKRSLCKSLWIERLKLTC